MSKHTKKVNKTKSPSHKKIVGAVLAAAFAFAVMVGVQVSEINSNQLSADMASCTSGGGAWTESTQFCQMPSGGTTTPPPSTPSTMSCNNAGGTMMTPAECDAVDARKNSCTSPSTWSTSGGGTCTAAATGGYAAFTCPNGTYYPAGTGTAPTCPVATVGSCTSTQTWNASTSTCVNNTTTTTCSGGQWMCGSTGQCSVNNLCPTTGTTTSCTSGQYWSGSACVNSMTTGTTGNSPSIYTSWNNLGLSSMICTTADQTKVAAAKVACANTPTGQQGLWTTGTTNHGDCTANPNAGIPVCSGSAATNTSTTCSTGMYWNGSYCQAAPVGVSTYVNEANKYVTEPTCTSKGFFWANNFCYASKEMVPGSMNTGSNTEAGCKASNGFWVAATAAGSQGYCKWDTTNMKPVDTVGNCTANNGTWNAGSSTCTYGTYTTKGGTWEKECTGRGGKWRTDGANGWCEEQYNYNQKQDQQAIDNMNAKMRAECVLRKGTFRNGPTETAVGWCEDNQNMQCQPPMYYDFGMQSCKMPGAAFENFKGDFQGQCPDWDMRCQEMQRNGDVNQQFINVNDFADTQCLSARDAKREIPRILRELGDLRMQLGSIDLERAEGSVISEGIGYIKQAKDLTANTSDLCAFGKARELLSRIHNPDFGFWDALNSTRMIAEFKMQLEQISFEIEDLEERYSYMGVKDKKIESYVAKAKAAVVSLKANPPYDEYNPQALWEALSPECQRQPMSYNRGGRGGGMQYQQCTLEQALDGNTPRGILEALRMAMEGQEQDRWAENICADAANGVAEFQAMVIDNDLKGGEEIIKDAHAAISLCNSTEDKSKVMPIFDRIRMRAETLMRKAGLEDFGGGEDFNRKFSGLENRLPPELLAQIDAIVAERVKAEVGATIDRFAAVMKEKLGDFAEIFDNATLTALTNSIDGLKAEFADNIAGSLEIAAVVRNKEAANEQQASLSASLDSLEVVGQASPELEAVLEETLSVVTERPYDNETLDKVEDLAKDAENLAKNGEDPSEALLEIKKLLTSEDDRRQNMKLVDDGLLEHIDIDTKAWYADEATEAGVLFDLGTVNKEGYMEARPTVGLNVAEGLVTAAKAASIEPNSNVSREIKSIVGNIDWAGEWFQGMYDAGVPVATLAEKVRAAGGITASMERGEAVDAIIEIMKAKGVECSGIDTEDQIGHYEDYDRLSAEQKQDQACANNLGISTGAADGTRADVNAPIERSQAFTMGVRMYHTLEGEGANSDFPTPPSGLEQDEADRSRDEN